MNNMKKLSSLLRDSGKTIAFGKILKIKGAKY